MDCSPPGSTGAGIVYPLQLVKNPPAMQETWVRSLGWNNPLEKGKGYLLQYSGLENSMNCIVHGVAKSWTTLSDFQRKQQQCREPQKTKKLMPYRDKKDTTFIKQEKDKIKR